jgi:hypothetical protein
MARKVRINEALFNWIDVNTISKKVNEKKVLDNFGS